MSEDKQVTGKLYVWAALCRVYNMDGVSDKAKSIIGDVMLGLPSAQPKAQLSEESTTKGTTFDCISRESVYNLLRRECSTAVENHLVDKIRQLPSIQPQYEELTPEKAASEIASGSIVSALYWLDPMIQLKQMGYVVCRKK